MNYLETGLPHTDFCRRKTDFSPPRYIPLCGGLGRKYLGLEPLSRRELGVLIRRLSEPKKSTDCGEEQMTDLTQVRRKTAPGTGRFVGQKKMSSFEIEKMVDRLYSRRSTKDYAFVDETVEANDIINMTNKLDEESDSEDETEETKVAKNRENSLLRRHSGVKTTTVPERKRSPTIRRESRSTTVYEQYKPGKNRIFTEVKDLTEGSLMKIDSKPRHSVSFQRSKSLIETGRKVQENKLTTDKHLIKTNECSDKHLVKTNECSDKNLVKTNECSDKNLVKTNECSNSTKQEHSCSPLPPRRCNSEIVTAEKPDEKRSTKAIPNFTSFPKSFAAEITRPSPSKIEIPLSHGLEITRPSPSRIEIPLSHGLENSPITVQVHTPSTTCDIIADEHNIEKNIRSPRDSKSRDSPRLSVSKSDDKKNVRYTATPCDELLIDRVATYNRGPRLRCK